MGGGGHMAINALAATHYWSRFCHMFEAGGIALHRHRPVRSNGRGLRFCLQNLGTFVSERKQKVLYAKSSYIIRKEFDCGRVVG